MGSSTQPYQLNKEASKSSHNGAQTIPATQIKPVSPASSISSVRATETPLDLTKANGVEETETNKQNSNRKRSRKGKAFKLDALCLRLQEKMGSGNAKVRRSSFLHSDESSSPSGHNSNQYPSPTGEGTWSDNSRDKTSPINYKINIEETNNNDIRLHK